MLSIQNVPAIHTNAYALSIQKIIGCATPLHAQTHTSFFFMGGFTEVSDVSDLIFTARTAILRGSMGSFYELRRPQGAPRTPRRSPGAPQEGAER